MRFPAEIFYKNAAKFENLQLCALPLMTNCIKKRGKQTRLPRFGVLYAYTGRELKIFGLYAVRLDGKAKECVAKLREIISESRLLIVPTAFAVAKLLCCRAVYTFVSVGVCSNGNMNGKVVPIDTTVAPIKISDILNRLAIPVAPSTNQSAPLINKALFSASTEITSRFKIVLLNTVW